MFQGYIMNDFFCKDISTKYIENITGNYEDIDFSMFKAQCYLNGVIYSCERIFKNGRNGLYFKRDDVEYHVEYGFNIEAEDPRIFILNETVYIIFICLSPYENQNRCIGITTFNEWKPIFLQLQGVKKNVIEKNWAPFVKNNKLYIVYNYDPLVIIHYDFNEAGYCNKIFTQNKCNLPIKTEFTYLRGGSNLLPYKDDIYIGGCHSRIYKNDIFEHYCHIILLDTNKWELIYVSKPVAFNYDKNEKLNSFQISPNSFKELDTLNNILIDKSPYIIQDPVSLYFHHDKYFITINVRDSVSLLYELTFDDSIMFLERDKPINFYDNLVFNMINKSFQQSKTIASDKKHTTNLLITGIVYDTKMKMNFFHR